jgi:Universal stress protein family
MGIQYRLEKLGRRLKSLRDRVRSILLFGSPEDVISKRADDIKAKLIAFGSNGALSGGVQQKLIDSVTRRVSCPVITITSKAG